MIEITYESRAHHYLTEQYKDIKEANAGMARMWKETKGWWLPISAVRIRGIAGTDDTAVEKVLNIVATFHIEDHKHV
jgi:hypothetical protein